MEVNLWILFYFLYPETEALVFQIRALAYKTRHRHAHRDPLGLRAVWRSGPQEVAVRRLVLGRGHRQQAGVWGDPGVSTAHFQLPNCQKTPRVAACGLTKTWHHHFSFQEDPRLQSHSGLLEQRLRGGGGSREGSQRLPEAPQHRDVPHQTAGGESAHTARGHYEGGGQLSRPPGQQRHLQRGVVEP